MSERTEYAPGVPCWVDTWQSDAAATAAFYADLLGWDTELTTPDRAEAQYVMCRLRGRDVAAIGSGASGMGAVGASAPAADASARASGASAPPAGPDASPATWTTYVQVASVDDAVATAREAGGAIVAPPFDSLDGGRIAILADPAGATFGVWAPGAHRGAQLVNEPAPGP